MNWDSKQDIVGCWLLVVGCCCCCCCCCFCNYTVRVLKEALGQRIWLFPDDLVVQYIPCKTNSSPPQKGRTAIAILEHLLLMIDAWTRASEQNCGSWLRYVFGHIIMIVVTSVTIPQWQLDPWLKKYFLRYSWSWPSLFRAWDIRWYKLGIFEFDCTFPSISDHPPSQFRGWRIQAYSKRLSTKHTRHMLYKCEYIEYKLGFV